MGGFCSKPVRVGLFEKNQFLTLVCTFPVITITLMRLQASSVLPELQTIPIQSAFNYHKIRNVILPDIFPWREWNLYSNAKERRNNIRIKRNKIPQRNRSVF